MCHALICHDILYIYVTQPTPTPSLSQSRLSLYRWPVPIGFWQSINLKKPLLKNTNIQDHPCCHGGSHRGLRKIKSGLSVASRKCNIYTFHAAAILLGNGVGACAMRDIFMFFRSVPLPSALCSAVSIRTHQNAERGEGETQKKHPHAMTMIYSKCRAVQFVHVITHPNYM